VGSSAGNKLFEQKLPDRVYSTTYEVISYQLSLFLYSRVQMEEKAEASTSNNALRISTHTGENIQSTTAQCTHITSHTPAQHT